MNSNRKQLQASRQLARPVVGLLPALTFPSSPLPDSQAFPVQPLGPEDGAACLALDRLALGGLWSLEQWQRELLEPARPVLGRRDQEGRLLALVSAWLVAEELQITALAVHPAHRRLGLGREVLQALLNLARQAGADRACLEVSCANQAARQLYASLGFAEVALRRGYYRNGDDAVVELLHLRG